MGKFIDLTGQKFGRLTVLSRAENSKCGRVMWNCICDCGNHAKVSSNRLKQGETKSCGCLRKSDTKNYSGKKELRLYRIWNSMNNRCRPKYDGRYGDYVIRGITVCDEWLHDFQAFYEWAMANGYSDDLTLDRKDNDGNYCPENCRWITRKEQANNTRRNHYVTYNGETHTIAEWATIKEKKYSLLYSRLCVMHWDIGRALNT